MGSDVAGYGACLNHVLYIEVCANSARGKYVLEVPLNKVPKASLYHRSHACDDGLSNPVKLIRSSSFAPQSLSSSKPSQGTPPVIPFVCAPEMLDTNPNTCL